MKIQAFTSITGNYIPKARVLAASLKAHHPEWGFHVVLSDEPPPDSGLDDAAIDGVIAASSLPIDDFRRWAFRHSVVELCTAVKGPALNEIARRTGADVVIYFDPDIVVAGRLDDLVRPLDDGASVLLTPHLTAPEASDQGVRDNEITALKHGTYNLGFVAVRFDDRGRRFARWWDARLRAYCEDNIPAGLFTDQRWVDLAPALFDGVHIVRSSRYNVATWNLSNRRMTGTPPDRLLVDGEPLGFYHFSGLDRGACAAMIEVHVAHSPVLRDFLDWYLARCDECGQQTLGQTPWRWGRYADGTPIERDHRLLYRVRPDLQAAFADPYGAGPGSYLEWLRGQGAAEMAATPGFVARSGDAAALAAQGAEALRQLELIQRSRSYRLARLLARAYRLLSGARA